MIGYGFETCKVGRIIWIRGKLKPADPLTRVNSPVVPMLQFKMFSGKPSVSFLECISLSSIQFTGQSQQQKREENEKFYVCISVNYGLNAINMLNSL